MQFGDYRIEVIPDTEFWLDGGAMFGVVPRVLWEKVCPPDDLNRIRLNMNCLFVETRTERILIETGIGEKWTAREIEMYGISREKTFADILWERTGCRPDDITIVVNTHLHFDHAGGNTIGDFSEIAGVTDNAEKTGTSKISESQNSENQSPKPASLRPQFPAARYFVSRSELEHAESPHERDRASYRPENWRPLLASGQLELKPDEYEVVEGLTVQKIRGHSETMQTICLRRGGQTLYGFADLIPTRAHLPYAWIMGYDLFPTETLEAKKRLIPQAVRENWICLFYHDPEAPLCRLTEENRRISAVAVQDR